MELQSNESLMQENEKTFQDIKNFKPEVDKVCVLEVRGYLGKFEFIAFLEQAKAAVVDGIFMVLETNFTYIFVFDFFIKHSIKHVFLFCISKIHKQILFSHFSNRFCFSFKFFCLLYVHLQQLRTRKDFARLLEFFFRHQCIKKSFNVFSTSMSARNNMDF